ncbi:MAG: sigma-70 family RNA polymerase sigma factor [Clostridia bacterium]|nr:sigma-70 family RNA polymerase sigma factor [Clostridia bacterium]
MNRENAEKIITEYLKPIFGFALKRTKSIYDAEDLTQDIVLKAFRALIVKDDIEDANKFIWTIAHNALSNYYRTTAKSIIGVSIDEVAEVIPDPDSMLTDEDNADTVCRLQSEIAYLSKLQRRIVIAYYFENCKQADIAKELNIPLGTVKWHLFEAKKELKRGMETMRKTSELKFNPIKFSSFGINGSIGTKSCEEFFRSALSQNICYCVRNEAKTINEIADALGVSPVYIETEVDFLDEYGFLKRTGDKYIVNFIISELTPELLTMQDAMYKKAAGLFANELYDELMNSGILDDEAIFCNQMLQGSSNENPLRDKNFLLWSLIPYIAAMSGEKLIDSTITFEEVATIRPDGAHNIAHATVVPNDLKLPNDYVCMRDWCGPYYDTNGDHTLWRVDSEWSGRRIDVNQYDHEVAERILSLYEHEEECLLLSKEDYAWLSERGYIKTWGDYDGYFKTSWQVIVLRNKEIKTKLLEIGEKIKEKYKYVFEDIKAPYVEAVLNSVPTHLRKAKAYELQFIFHADGWFLLHCIVALLNNGKLKPPTEGQRKSLSTIILSK